MDWGGQHTPPPQKKTENLYIYIFWWFITCDSGIRWGWAPGKWCSCCCWRWCICCWWCRWICCWCWCLKNKNYHILRIFLVLFANYYQLSFLVFCKNIIWDISKPWLWLNVWLDSLDPHILVSNLCPRIQMAYANSVHKRSNGCSNDEKICSSYLSCSWCRCCSCCCLCCSCCCLCCASCCLCCSSCCRCCSSCCRCCSSCCRCCSICCCFCSASQGR